MKMRSILSFLCIVQTLYAQCANINSLPNANTGFRALTYNLEGWKTKQDGFAGIKSQLRQLQNKNVDIMGFQEADQGANNGIKSTLEGMGMYQVLFQDPPGVALYANRRWSLAGGKNIPVGTDKYWTRYVNVAILRNSAGFTIEVANYHGCLEPTNPYDYGCQHGLTNALSTSGFFNSPQNAIFTCDCNDYSNIINNGGSTSLNAKGLKVINKPCGGLAGLDWIAAGSSFTMKQRYTFGGNEGAYTSDHSAMLVDFYFGGSGPTQPPSPTGSCCLYQNQCINDDYCNQSKANCLGPCNAKGDKTWGPPGGGGCTDAGSAESWCDPNNFQYCAGWASGGYCTSDYCKGCCKASCGLCSSHPMSPKIIPQAPTIPAAQHPTNTSLYTNSTDAR